MKSILSNGNIQKKRSEKKEKHEEMKVTIESMKEPRARLATTALVITSTMVARSHRKKSRCEILFGFNSIAFRQLPISICCASKSR